MKRIWSAAAAVPSDNGMVIMLDGRALKKPGGEVLCLPFPALAEAIAAEWQQAGLHGAEIKPDDLKLTRLANTAAERVRPGPEASINQLAAYGQHDLLCYRAAAPAALAALQAQSWQPWLNWAAETYGVQLDTAEGVVPVAQPAAAAAAFKAALQNLDIYQLTALGVAVPALGSLVLGLAMAAGKLSAAEACRLAWLDEDFQAEKWGRDSEAEARRAAILSDLESCGIFMRLCLHSQQG